MNLGKVIYSVLSNDSDVGGVAGDRIYPMHAPQGATYPFITYMIDGVIPHETKDGASSLDYVEIVIGCFGETYSVTSDLGVKVRAAIDRYSGTVSGVTVQNTTFDDIENDYVKRDNQFEHFTILDFTMVVKN